MQEGGIFTLVMNVGRFVRIGMGRKDNGLIFLTIYSLYSAGFVL
jgi:hypothetical protein